MGRLLSAPERREIAHGVGRGRRAPRPVQFAEPSERVKTEMAELKRWYTVFGAEFDPLR